MIISAEEWQIDGKTVVCLSLSRWAAVVAHTPLRYLMADLVHGTLKNLLALGAAVVILDPHGALPDSFFAGGGS